MRKFSKVRYLTTALVVSGTAAAIAVSGVMTPPASAATGPPSTACTAAIATYHQAQSNLESALNAQKKLQDQVNTDNTVIANYTRLESQETAAIKEEKSLTSTEGAEEALLPSARGNNAAIYITVMIYAIEIGATNNMLIAVEAQLNALNEQYQQANSDIIEDKAKLSALSSQANAAGDAFQAALEAVKSACQETTAPTATPASGSPTTTPSGDGSTQQYYQNGARFVLLDDGIILTGGGSVQADCAETAADPGADNTGNSGAGRAGNFPQDTGPTVADQAAWISGCAAQENAWPVSVLSSVTPVATTPAAATGSPAS
jgi:hypothetical protein